MRSPTWVTLSVQPKESTASSRIRDPLTPNQRHQEHEPDWGGHGPDCGRIEQIPQWSSDGGKVRRGRSAAIHPTLRGCLSSTPLSPGESPVDLKLFLNSDDVLFDYDEQLLLLQVMRAQPSSPEDTINPHHHKEGVSVSDDL